jgi:EAL domain-containing protein (putative c-di-GMP-specific phosphodiesterase class I)
MGLPPAPAPATLPSIRIEEALRKGWFEDWYQPKIDLKRKCLAGAEASACIRHPSLGLLTPGQYACGVGADSIGLAERVLVAMLASWPSFDAAGFNLRLATKVSVRVLLALPVEELVAEHRPASDRWPGIILQVNEDDIVRDVELGARRNEPVARERNPDRDRRFRRRLFLARQLAQAVVRRDRARS